MAFKASPDPLKHEQAIDWFSSRIPTLDIDQLDAELDPLVFRVAGVTQLDILQSVFDALNSSLADGTPFDDFKADVADMLEQSWGGEIPGRLETIFRTNLQNAYGAGRYAEQYSHDQKKSRPYVRIDVTLDSRTSDICEAIADMGPVPKDGSWIESHHPPLHFNCRSSEVDLTEDEARELGLEDDPPSDKPAEGFGGVPAFDWAPNVDNYDEALKQFVPD